MQKVKGESSAKVSVFRTIVVSKIKDAFCYHILLFYPLFLNSLDNAPA